MWRLMGCVLAWELREDQQQGCRTPLHPSLQAGPSCLLLPLPLADGPCTSLPRQLVLLLGLGSWGGLALVLQAQGSWQREPARQAQLPWVQAPGCSQHRQEQQTAGQGDRAAGDPSQVLVVQEDTAAWVCQVMTPVISPTPQQVGVSVPTAASTPQAPLVPAHSDPAQQQQQQWARLGQVTARSSHLSR